MSNDLKVKAIFDNGGGITLQLGDNYAHYYDNPEQAAEDYKIYIQDGNADGWDGNEEENMEWEPNILEQKLYENKDCLLLNQIRETGGMYFQVDNGKVSRIGLENYYFVPEKKRTHSAN
jgi:hypothetical protein